MVRRIAVISARRPGAVARMKKHLADLGPVTWYVAKGDAKDYLTAGAVNVVESGDLCTSRNAALGDAWLNGADCVQLSDDLKGLRWAFGKTTNETLPISLRAAVAHLRHACTQHGAFLAGAMPTANAFYAAPAQVQLSHFIVGDLLYVRHGTPLRFDTTLTLKEDYDYTLQHIAWHGRVARVGSLLADFAHRDNPGGAVDIRNPYTEQDNIDRLKAKWGDVIRDNPRRANEILLKIPPGWHPHVRGHDYPCQADNCPTCQKIRKQ